jgi:hypothetical protein
VLDGRVGAKARAFRIWASTAAAAVLAVSWTTLTAAPAYAAGGPAAFHVPAASNVTIHRLLGYRELALLAVALTCITGLIIIRVRRRREARREARGLLEAGTARGRHAVGGPAGFGELHSARAHFTHRASTRRGIPDPAVDRPGPGTRRPGDQAVDEPGPSSYPPDEPPAGRAPAEEAYAGNGAPAGGESLGILQSWGLEPGDNGISQAPAGPPWEPAEKPPGEPPWEPTSPPWERDRDVTTPPRLLRPGDVADVWPPRPPDTTGR